jgi:two-component system, LuxR family, sensor kinase FixL
MSYENLTKAELIERLKMLEGRADPRDTAERLRAILETAVEAIITIDERGIVEAMNPAAEKIFGYAAAEVVGRNVSMLMPSPDREQHDRYVRNYVRTGEAKIIGIGREVVGQRKDGTVFPMDLAVSEVRLMEKRLFTGFVRDITERKRAEELERSLLKISEREQTRIGQDLHDGLGQHLAGIELMSQVLEQKLAARKLKAEAARAGDIARHVRDAISQTRLLARGLSPFVLESEGLASALKELAHRTESVFGVACEFRMDGKLAVSNVVANHLYRIAQEAVTNAVKHGKAERIDIRLETSNAQVALSVKDNGRGIPSVLPENRGIGLRIMQYRAGVIGATLTAERDPAGGTVVRCTLPRDGN